ncbi:MAG: hypothetical protein NT092_11130 [Bacteroidia bacterium]|nr:hypothetical protein [Bacteroidia bacterium]
MRAFYTILKILAILVIIVTATLFFGSFVMQDTVAAIILRSLNKDISTKYEFESVRLSYLKKFPNASLDLKNVLVHSSPGFDKTDFEGINTDTLLFAESVSVEFKITDVVKGIYDINRIGVRDGRMNLFTDLAGAVNYDIAVENEEYTTSGDFLLNLEKINVSGVKATYNNLATQLLIRGFIDNGRIKSRISGDNIDFAAEGGLRIDLFSLYDFSLSNSIPANIDINLFRSGKGYLFNKSNLMLDNYLFGLSGFISSDNVLDLIITGENIDVSGVKNYLPEKIRERIAGYNPSGVMNIKGKIAGPVTTTTNPGMQIDFSVRNGNVTYGASALNIKDLSFSGMFTNGSSMVPATSSLAISSVRGTLGSSQFTGSLLLSDFDTLYGKLDLKGKVIPSEIREFFNLKDVSVASGSIDLDLKMEGLIPDKEKYSVSDFFSLNPDADLKFNSFNLGIGNEKVLVKDVTGRLMISDTVHASNLKLSYKDQTFLINGIFINLPGWLAGDPVVLNGTAEISCGKLMPEKLFPVSADTISGNETAFRFPCDIIMDLNLKIDHFIYKTFEANNITGRISYKPRILNFKTLKLYSLDGIISGDGFVVQNTDKAFISRGSFVFEKIDVKKAFESFKNFAQTFLVSENLKGTLTGSLSLLLPMDSLFNPVYKSITAEGKFGLTDGALINFGPVKELSSFIELSELENINFDKLENDFFIRNNFLYLPQMDVRSSAADLSINGKHSLDNEYEYHVKILLSEALSRKIHKPKSNTTEFGAVQDDGLGRTSLLLKIEGNGEDVKVGYDVKAAGTKVKSEIKSERQNLKTILNQEYGWYKNDSTVTKTTTPASKKFRITWDEADSSKVQPELPMEQKEPGIRNIFRKKNE